MNERKIDVVIVDVLEPENRRRLSHAMNRVCGNERIAVAQEAFDATGHIRSGALEAITDVMSRGGTVFVDLPDAARSADNFNDFARRVMSGADHKAGTRNHGKMLFNKPADTLIATMK